jgi:guanine deaminase
VNTHISENPTECREVLEQRPDCADYLSIYEKHGLVGPKFTGGHGVHLTDDEFRRMSRSGAAVCFCPCSNLFLGSGFFPIGKATDPEYRVKTAFGSDVGGGNRFCLLHTLDEAYKVGMHQSTMLLEESAKHRAEAERSKISPYRGFWSITLGGAEALHLDQWIGNFEPGKEADFVVLDWKAGPTVQEWHQSLHLGKDNGPQTVEAAADLLFGIMMVGDDRNVAETWIMGERAYQKEP